MTSCCRGRDLPGWKCRFCHLGVVQLRLQAVQHASEAVATVLADVGIQDCPLRGRGIGHADQIGSTRAKIGNGLIDVRLQAVSLGMAPGAH